MVIYGSKLISWSRGLWLVLPKFTFNAGAAQKECAVFSVFVECFVDNKLYFH